MITNLIEFLKNISSKKKFDVVKRKEIQKKFQKLLELSQLLIMVKKIFLLKSLFFRIGLLLDKYQILLLLQQFQTKKRGKRIILDFDLRDDIK